VRLKFAFGAVEAAEFGVAVQTSKATQHFRVPADKSVQNALIEMAQRTEEQMRGFITSPEKFEPSQKYESREYLFLPLTDTLALPLKSLHEAVNLSNNSSIMRDTDDVFFYFARLTDAGGKKLTCVRRATQFKGVLKSQMVTWFNDSVRFLTDPVFRLDPDFDLLIDEANIHILRPSGFEFAGQAEKAVLTAVPENIRAVSAEMPYVNFEPIKTYASTHPRAARVLGSLRSQDLKGIAEKKLKRLCAKLHVKVSVKNGLLQVDEAQLLDFLEVLDRRRFDVDLLETPPEQFRAGARTRILPSGAT
jgi:hypothetical protein